MKYPYTVSNDNGSFPFTWMMMSALYQTNTLS